MQVTDEFLAELEAAAKAAKDGDWAAETSHRVFVSGPVQPAHVLALIAELREARQTIYRLLDDAAISFEEGQRR